MSEPKPTKNSWTYEEMHYVLDEYDWSKSEEKAIAYFLITLQEIDWEDAKPKIEEWRRKT